jgi:predicted nucleic acid-binding protein
MPKILVDTNIFLDVFQRDPVWMPWSAQQLRLGQASGCLVTNVVVYAELLGHPKFNFDLDAFLQQQAIGH